MTIVFNLEDLHRLKRGHPDWVILLGDKAKNPQRIVGAWKELTTQTPQILRSCSEGAKL
jgi:hypothetical protein